MKQCILMIFGVLIFSYQTFGADPPLSTPGDSARILEIPTTVNFFNAELISKLRQTVSSAGQDPVKLVNSKFDGVPLAITTMQNAANILDFSTSLLLLEQNLSNVQSIWHDEEIRNLWDHAESIGSSVGLIVSGVSLLLPNLSTDQKLQVGSAGLSVSAISSLIGYFLGKQSPLQVQETLLVLEMSRVAFDDLQERKNYLTAYTSSIQVFNLKLKGILSEYQALQKEISTTQAPVAGTPTSNRTEDKKRVVEKISASLGEFDALLTGLNGYFDRVISMDSISIFSEKIKNIERLQQTREGLVLIIKDARTLRQKYNDIIIPQINVSADMRSMFSY